MKTARLQFSQKHTISFIAAAALLLSCGYYFWQAGLVVLLLLLYFAVYRGTGSWTQLVLFGCVLVGFLLSDIVLWDGFYFQYESVRYLCLFLPFCIRTQQERERFLQGILAGATALSVIGLVAFAGQIEYANLTADGRLQSVVGYANTMAVIGGIGAGIAFFYAWKQKDRRGFFGVLAALNLAALILTFSRLGLASFAAAAGIALCFWNRRARYIVLSVAMLALLIVIVIFATGHEALLLGSSFVSRLIYWHDALRLLWQNPFGIGVYGWEQQQYQAASAIYSVKYVHNSYLQIALDGGVFSLLAVVVVMALGLFNTIRQFIRTHQRVYLLCIFLIALIGIHAFFDFDFSYSTVLLILGCALSFGCGEGRQIHRTWYVVAIILCSFVFVGSFHPGARESEMARLSVEFQSAVQREDPEAMLLIADQWIQAAPFQQAGYDAKFLAIDKLRDLGYSNKYKEEMTQLIQEVDAVNARMNPLSRYLDRHTKIVIPGDGS